MGRLQDILPTVDVYYLIHGACLEGTAEHRHSLEPRCRANAPQAVRQVNRKTSCAQ